MLMQLRLLQCHLHALKRHFSIWAAHLQGLRKMQQRSQVARRCEVTIARVEQGLLPDAGKECELTLRQHVGTQV